MKSKMARAKKLGLRAYLGGRFECALAQALGLLRLPLLHDHRVVRGARRDHHRRVRVATMHALVEHNVLWVVLPIVSQNISG